MDLKDIKNLYKRYLKLRKLIDPDGSKKQYYEDMSELEEMQERLLDSIQYLIGRLEGREEMEAPLSDLLKPIVSALEEIRYRKDV